MTSDYHEFVSDLEVVCGHELGSGWVYEINSKSNNINQGFGPTFVRLRMDRFESEPTSDTALKDLSFCHYKWGVDVPRLNPDDEESSDPRWIFPVSIREHREGEPVCITEVGLWRSKESQDVAPPGWHGKGTDINKGRGGDYLYLVWKTKLYTGPMKRVGRHGR